MNPAHYLPSARFALIVGSLVCAGGLVFAADYVTSPHAPTTSSIYSAANTKTGSNWLEALREVQAQNSTYTLPAPPSESMVEGLLGAAQSSNITDSVGRTLLINLSSAKAQGLGGDIPTQEKLIAEALTQISKERGTPAYSAANLEVVARTDESLRAYGNRMMEVMRTHTEASYFDTLLAVGYATDLGDESKLEPLLGIGQAYKGLVGELALISVPQTLTPLHLQILNNLSGISNLYADMATILKDPLRGLAAFELYESLTEETSRVFTNIGQQLSSSGILFNESEPGYAWSSFIDTPQ